MFLLFLLVLPSSKSLVSLDSRFSPSLLLPPPLPITASSSALLPLVPFSPSASHLVPHYTVELPLIFWSPALGSKVKSSKNSSKNLCLLLYNPLNMLHYFYSNMRPTLSLSLHFGHIFLQEL